VRNDNNYLRENTAQRLLAWEMLITAKSKHHRQQHMLQQSRPLLAPRVSHYIQILSLKSSVLTELSRNAAAAASNYPSLFHN